MNLQIIISGIGGQGVLFVTEILAQAALSKGYKVIGSETHGMAQRGGSVISHLKMGDFQSPLVRTGTADIIYAFDQTEFLRSLPFIRKQGICFINAPDGNFLSDKVSQYLTKNQIKLCYINANKVALDLGNLLSVNLIMLGFSLCANLPAPMLRQVGLSASRGTSGQAGRLPFSKPELEQTIREITPNRFLEMNFKAFRSGYEVFNK